MKDKYGLVGYPLKHSFSKKFFTEKFLQENINAEYVNFEIPDIIEFPNIISENPSLKGLNVTIPYKETVIPYLDSLDEECAAIGAVNVIKIIREKENTLLKGYNTDLIGFRESIRPLLESHHTKALVLGTGGASKAVVQGLNGLGIETKYVSRTAQEGVFTYQQLNKNILDEYKVIVNASPLGTFPKVEEYPPIPYQYITNQHLLYDLVYNPPVTTFLNLGKQQGAKVKNGQQMLELQALAAWRVWGE